VNITYKQKFDSLKEACLSHISTLKTRSWHKY